MNKLKQKLMSLMYGRYGVDELYYVLFTLCIVITIANTFVQSAILYIIEILILFIMVYRSFSKKYAKRKRENDFFLGIWRPIKNWVVYSKDRIRDRKTARYRKCTHCRAILKLPNKKGKHTVVCPKCHERFDVKI